MVERAGCNTTFDDDDHEPVYGSKTTSRWRQLKLLLWKNFIHKKRSPVATACEVFVPVMLFLVLAGVRSTHPSFNVPSEYNQAVPLPSAGLIPMLQFFCPEVSSDPYGFPDYRNTRVPELLEFVTAVYDKFPEYTQMMETLLVFVKGVTDDDKKSGSTEDFSEMFNDLQSDPEILTMFGNIPKSLFMKDKGELEVHHFLHIFQQLESFLPENDACNPYNPNDTDNEDSDSDTEQDGFIIVDADTNIKVSKKPIILLVKLWNSVQSALCGINNTVNETVFNEPDWIHKLGFTDTQIVKFQFMAFLFLNGQPQILYAPNTTDVNEVIAKANEPLATLDSLRKTTQICFNLSLQLSELLNRNSTVALYESLQQLPISFKVSDNEGQEDWLHDAVLPNLTDVQHMVASLTQVTCKWNSVMSKVNLNLFQPFVDEKSMARYSTEADRNDNITVIAGLVFETDENGELPHHTIYKIKLNASYAPSTMYIEPKAWFQQHAHNPRRSLIKYLFTMIQDVIERATIEKRVGYSASEVGSYIREFPNPCHVQDIFFISVFFSKAKIAAACAGLVYLFLSVPFIYIQDIENVSYQTIEVSNKILSCLLSVSGYGLGLRYIMLYELQATGVQWSNLNTPWPVYHGDITIGQVMLLMILDCVIYILLMWYIEAIHPGPYGVPQPWYFPFLKSYWCSSQSGDHLNESTIRRQSGQDGGLSIKFVRDHLNCGMYEDEPVTHSVGVQIKRLVKLYEKGKLKAVNDLSLNLYEDQITALLGHNGAGKTTIMSILTGFITPTSGTAIINGKDIRREMVQIRQSLGICPQYNALFDKLTVLEHLWFYGEVKGVAMEGFQAEMESILTDIGLYSKKHSTIKTLSGGMKRKLSVAVAFTGGAKTVILDEPTAGVDPYSRRAIWDLLQKYKQDRTILLSTHHMDEASLLGDRIAILSNGQLKCCGSPQYLKSNLGDGYRLTLVKQNKLNWSGSGTYKNYRDESGQMDTFSSPKVTLLIQEYLPPAALITENENELIYLIPVKNIKKSSFIELFDALSKSKEQFGISAFGMTEVTLEQIFLKVMETKVSAPDKTTLHPKLSSRPADQHKPAQSQSAAHVAIETRDEDEEQLFIAENGATIDGSIQRLSKIDHLLLMFYGLMIKRLQYTKRDIKTLLSQVVLPVLFIAVGVSIAVLSLNIQKNHSLTLTSSLYRATPYYVPYTDVRKTLPSNLTEGEFQDTGVDKLLDTLHYPGGLGATCLLSSPFNSTLDGLLHTNSSIELTSKDFNQMCQKTIPKSLRVTFPYMESTPLTNLKGNQSDSMCSCNADNTGLECSDDGSDLPSYQPISSEIVQNVSGRNFTKYILKSMSEYWEDRYFALGFGYVRSFVPSNFSRLNVSSPLRKLAKRNAVVVWYFARSFPIGGAVSLNMINNAILRANIDKTTQGNPSAYGITIVNEPILTERVLNSDFANRGIYLQVTVFTLIGVSFIPASVMVFLVSERASKAKHLHFISGVSPFVYWLSNYMWDMLVYLVPVTFCVIIIKLFDVPVYSTSTNLPAVCALFVLYGWSVIPLMYLSSNLFDVPSTAYVISLVVNVFVGLIATLSMFFIKQLGNRPLLDFLGKMLDKLFLLFPNYCLGHGLIQLPYNDMLNTFYTKLGQYDKVQHPLEWGILSHMLVAMAIEGFVFFAFTLLYEYRYISRLCCKQMNSRRCNRKSNKNSTLEEDSDVIAERERVLEGSEDILQLINLTKVYEIKKTGNLLAVNRICLGVAQGQCFGLLGVNGAGKTTLFQMLTGDKSITSGDAYLHGYSISNNIRKVYRHIGYCPQYDVLYDKLTGREHLNLYARLHGIQAKQRKEIVHSTLKKLNLLHYADKQAGTYSGGNKRKLSTAISLIGNPTVLFMDEPTTGMDPQSKRFLWNVIHDIVKSGTSVIFTSHSMEECENLCSRLAIMVNGQFKCIGSIQHLKSKFGDGYTITVILNKNQPKQQQIRSFFLQTFPGSVMKDCHCNTVQFEIKSRSLSDIFSKLEAMKETSDIEDYSVRQTSLDDVFVNFAKQQHKASQVVTNPTTIENEEKRESQEEEEEEVENLLLQTFPPENDVVFENRQGAPLYDNLPNSTVVVKV
ncbi:ATP-binding cassette sub-family A member 2-like [Glandiceps talaboti]